MQDGAIFYQQFAEQPESIDINGEFVLSTIHRQENTDDPARLTQIVEALSEIAQSKTVILPLHPRTNKIIKELGLDISSLTVIEPVGYLNMVWLISNASLVVTDSGGLQKEAYFFQKPCITMRDETEWVELVEHNANVLVGADKEKILKTYHQHQFTEDFSHDLYGNGKASATIINHLLAS